jgi:predicted metal-dependent TIM-barrel fold hydrolase
MIEDERIAKALKELDQLLKDMESVNVGQYGLKAVIHEQWKNRLRQNLYTLKAELDMLLSNEV